MEIATLFEQSILLISQVFNPITYHRRLNILNTLIDNSIKVKEILKEPNLDLDDMENPYLFWEKCEWKLLKIRSAKQKSESIFTGLQQKNPTFSSRPNYNQPFLSGSLPRNQQGRSASGRERGFFFSRTAAARGKDVPSLVSSTWKFLVQKYNHTYTLQWKVYFLQRSSKTFHRWVVCNVF